jgi:ribosomal protein S18 acetylase RimI-like enzyme
MLSLYKRHNVRTNSTLAIGPQTMMIIRKATQRDADVIASIMLLAMEEIVYRFIGEPNTGKAREFLFYFCSKENNQYSWQNCWVAEMDNKVIAAVNIYDGAEFVRLRKPVVDYMKTHFHSEPRPEQETEAGEYYIDTLAVNPEHQGKGIGSIILRYLIEEFVIKEGKTLGLLVEMENPNARRFYLKLGFKPVETKVLFGKNMEHLQKKT